MSSCRPAPFPLSTAKCAVHRKPLAIQAKGHLAYKARRYEEKEKKLVGPLGLEPRTKGL